MFAIAKSTYCGYAKYFVTSIGDGGRTINNVRVDNGNNPWQARKFKTLAAANKARDAMAERGSYDDYHVIAL